MTITLHVFNYAWENRAIVLSDHTFGHVIRWYHCRTGFRLPDDKIRYTCKYVTTNGTRGIIYNTFAWIPEMARGMIVR